MSADVGFVLGSLFETAQTYGGTESADGGLVFGSAVTAEHGLMIDGAGAIIFADGLLVHGDLVLTHAGSVTFQGDVQVTGRVIIDAATTIQFGSHLNAGGAVALSADAIDFLGGAGSAALAGDLTVKTHTAGLATQIGFAVDSSGALSLTDSDLAALHLGGKLAIGGTESTGAVVVDSAQFQSDVAIGGSDITVEHVLLASGAQVALLGHGTVRNDGLIDVSSQTTFGSAGSLIITGQRAGNFGTILALGGAGTAGGVVTLSSTFQTLVGTAGVIDASGGTSGGTITLWSDGNTTMAGKLSAQGGSAGGDGGFIEVSSAGGFALLGTVNTLAAHGKTGRFLLDPKNVIIAASGPGTLPAVDQFSDTPGTDVTISAAAITGALSGVTIQANNDIMVNAALVNMPQDLTLQAGRSILINQSITLVNKTLTIIGNDGAGDPLFRDPGAASITTLAGVTLGAGSGTINLTLKAGVAGVDGITIDKVVTTGTLNISTAGFVRETIGDVAPSSGAMPSEDDLSAGILNLTVTSTTATFGEPLDQGNGALEVAAGTLNANVQLPGGAAASNFVGYFVLTDADHTNGSAGGSNPAIKDAPMMVGTFNAGGGSVILTAKGGSILGTAGATPNITAQQVNLVTEKFLGPDANAHYGAIGAVGSPLRTNVGMLTATASDGGLFISEFDSVLINQITVQDKGVTPQTGGSGTVVVTPAGQSATNGTSDAVIQAGLDMVLMDFKVADQLTLTAGGTILDGNQDTGNILARGLTLTAAGAIGDVTDSIETTIMTLQATTTNGGVFLAETDGVSVSSITAGGGGKNVLLTNATGSFVLGTVIANGGNVTLKAQFESISDGNGAAVNIVSATATLEGRTGLGTSSDPLEVNAGGLSTKVGNVGAATYVSTAGTLSALAIETNNGTVGISFAGGSVGFVQPGTTNQLSLAAPTISTFKFSNLGGSVAINSINAGTGAVTITAKTFINDFANDTLLNLKAGATILKAGTYIGTQANPIETDLDSLTATADAGGIFLSDAGSITSLTAIAKGTGNDIQIGAVGDLALAKVLAPDSVSLTAGGNISRLGNVLNISGASATLQAGGSMGTSGAPLLLDVRTLTSAVASNGGNFLKAKGVITATLVRAIGGDLEMSADGDLTLGLAEADASHTVKLTSTYGGLVDGNAGAINIRGGTGNLNAVRIGTSSDAIETELGTLAAVASSGGIYISELNGLTVTTLEAQGLGSDIVLKTGGDLILGSVKAAGDKVNIQVTGGAISDGNGGALNITADQLDITATGGIGALQNDVNRLGSANGGSGGVTISNVGALAITDATLEGRGASTLTIVADSITILDMTDNAATLDLNGSIQLTSRVGNVVFLDPNDAIVASGTGTIGISAGFGVTPTYPDTGAVAVIGNLTTAGGTIDVKANHHITIGLLNTQGLGNVSVVSETGVIIDGHGAATNIIGKVVTLSGALPGTRESQLEASIRTADYSALRSEAAAELISAQSFATATAIMNVQQLNALSAKGDATSAESEADQEAATADAAALAAYITATVLDGVATALGIVRDIVAIPSGAAQAIPLTGDGGAMTGYSVLDVVANVADVAAFAAGVVADQLGGVAEEKANALVKAGAELTALSATYEDSLATWKAFDEATSVSQKAADAAAIARDQSLVVRGQAILAEDQGNVIGTAAHPLGIQASKINATSTDGSIYLAVTGDVNLGGISTGGTNGVISVDASADIYVADTTVAPTQVSLKAGGSIIDAGGTIQAPNFFALAQNNIGSVANPIHTSIGIIAAHAITGTFGITNTGALEIGSINGTDGITSAGAAGVASFGSLTFKSAVVATGQTVTVSSQTGAIIDAHTGSPEITAQTLLATAASGMEFDTAISKLSAAVTGTGSVDVREADGITLTSVTTADGAISIQAGGTIVATSLISQTDADANGITLKSTNGGSILAGIINAGSTAGDVSLEASSVNGVISMLGGGRITADALSGTAHSGINITTAAKSADLNVTASGGLTVNEVDALLVTHLTTANGAISLTTGGLVTLAEGAVKAASGASDVTIDAGGAITGPLVANGAADILGAIVNLITHGAGSTIGASTGNPLEFNATTRFYGQTQDSHAYLQDLAGGLVIGAVDTGSGDFHLEAIGGSITAFAPGNGVAEIIAAHVDLKVTGAASKIGTAQAAQLEIKGSTLTLQTDGGSAFVSDTANGIAINTLDVGSGNLFLSATGGAITDNDGGAANNVTAKNLMFAASAGIGTGANPIEVTVAAFEGNGGSGGVSLSNLSGGIVLGGVTSAVAGVSAAGGNIVISTNGSLTVDEAVSVTGGGNVVLTALDSAATGDDLKVNANISATGAGGIKLQGGDDVVLALGVTVSALTGTVEIAGDYGDLDSGVGSSISLNGAIRAANLVVSSGADQDTVTLKDVNVSTTSVSTGADDDVITVAAGITLGSGTIDAGAGDDQVTISSPIQIFAGNDGDDQLLVKNGGAITGLADGGAGSDTFIYDHDGVSADDYIGPVTVNLQTLTATGLAAFSSFEGFQATSNANDHLIGADANSTWHLTGSNAGDIGGVSAFQFDGFENLTGGAKDDVFQIGAAGHLSGNLDGGRHTVHDTIDYNGSHFGAAATVALDGPVGGTATALMGRFDNIDQVIGDIDFAATNSLTGAGANNTWAFTGLDSGNISNVFFFQHFGAAGGGSGDDIFAFANNVLPSGVLMGGGGKNSLNLSAWTGDLVWYIKGDGSGTVTSSLGSFEFSGMTNLVSGNGNDKFVFSDDKILGQGLGSPGSIAGNGGTDFIDITAYTTANVWTRSGKDGTTETARGFWTYSSIEQFLGSKTTTFKFDVIDFIQTVTKVAMPAQMLPLHGGTISAQLTNIGNDEAVGLHLDVSYFLSLDGTLNSGDVLIGASLNRTVTLYPGHTGAVFSTVTKVPVGTAPGSYHLLAVVDSGNAVAEGDEFNNITDVGSFEVLPVLVDLQAAITKSTFPTVVLPGAKGALTATVTNFGNSPAQGKVDVEFFLSTDGTIDPSDIPLGGVLQSSLNLAGGASRVYTLNAQVPNGTPAADYQVLVRVDGRNQILESNESNNIGIGLASMHVNQPFVDLTAQFTQGQLPTIGIPNDVLKFQLPIHNLGNIQAKGTLDVDFYLSLDGVVDPATDILIKSLNDLPVAIAANGQKIINTSAIIPMSVQNGTYFVLADIHGSNTITESNLANNTTVLSDHLEVVWRFGNFADRRDVHLTVPDANGKLVTFSLHGQGVGNVIGGSAFSELSITGTDELSKITIVPKVGVITDLHDVIFTDSISQLYAPKATLRGDLLIGGTANSIVLGDVIGQHNMTIGEASKPLVVNPGTGTGGHTGPGAPVTVVRTLGLKLGHVENLLLNSGTPIRALAVRDWLDTDLTSDVITAPWFTTVTSAGAFQADIVATDKSRAISLGSMVVRGVASSDVTLAGGALSITVGGWSGGSFDATFAKTFNVLGDLADAQVTLSGLNLTATQLALGNLRVSGRVSDTLIDVRQNVGSVGVGTWGTGSVLSVGVNSGGDGTFFDGNETGTGGALGQFVSKSFESDNGEVAFGIVTDHLLKFIQLNKTTRYSEAALPVATSDLKLAVV